MNTTEFIAEILKQSKGQDEIWQACEVVMGLFNAGYTIKVRDDFEMTKQERDVLAQAVMAEVVA